MTKPDAFDDPPASDGVDIIHDVRRMIQENRTILSEFENRTSMASGDLSSARRRRLIRPRDRLSPTYEHETINTTMTNQDDEDKPRSAKRRKLDNSTNETSSFRYGRYGQIEPGRLKLKLHKCDGGVHDEGGTNDYGPQNILKHDQSVYSSKEPFCNIILRHHDDSAFCLEKLHLIGPRRGFTARVRKGHVYVGMSFEDLEVVADESEADNDKTYEDHLKSLVESMTEEEQQVAWSDGIMAVIRQREDLSEPQPSLASLRLPRPPLPSANRTSRRYGRIWSNDSDWPALPPLLPARGIRTRMTTSSLEEQQLSNGLNLSYDFDDEIEWPEDPSAPAVLADRERREIMENDDEDDSDDNNMYSWHARYHNLHRTRRVIRNASITPRQAIELNSLTDSREEKSKRKVDMSKFTHVPFSINAGQSKVAITFDPPVSGTAILLQIKSSPSSENVDLQTVIAKGYGLPRLFPAKELR